MMKKRLVWAILAAFVSTSMPAPAWADDHDDEAEDADLPAGATIDRAEYRRLREEHMALMRGVPHFQAYEPRSRALEEMAAAERSHVAIDPAFWTPLGPAPIPNGQTQAPSGPVSGRTVSIAVHPSNPDIVYVGTAQGGLYRTLDGGVNWTPIFDGAMSLAIGALAIAPSSPETLYVGTGEPNGSADSFFGVGLYRIDNASTTANLTGPINPAVTTGVAGTTAFTGRAVSRILVHPTDADTIFVATFTGTGGNPAGGSVGFTVPPLAMRGVYRSTNATSAAPSFTKLTVTNAGSIPPDTSGDVTISDIVMDPGDPNVIVAWVLDSAATVGSGGIYRTTNALAATPTFTQLVVTTTTAARGELAANRVAGVTNMWAATGDSNGRLRRSTDGGATWSAFLTGGVNFCNPQCFYDIAVAAHPTVADTVHLGGSPTLIQARSTDGGNTFTTNAATAAGLHVDTHVIVYAPSNPSIMYFGSDGGIWRSSDSGTTWTTRNNTQFNATQFQSLALHPTDREFMIGGTQDNGTEFKQPDGTWTRTDGGDGGYALIDQNAADVTNVTMYHTYFNNTTQFGFARKLSATPPVGGWATFGCGFTNANGMACPTATLFYAPMTLGPGNPQTVYMGSEQVWRSANQGATMASVSQVLVPGPPLLQSITTLGVSPVNDDFRIAGTRNGRVFMSNTPGATTMTDVTNAGMPLPNAADTQFRRPVARALFHPTDPNTAWVAFGGYGVAAGQHIWKTTNLSGGAATWAASGTGIPDVPVNSMTVDPAQPNNVYAATDIGVFATTDGGANWFPYSESLPRVAVFDIAFQNSTPRVLRIATHGRGIWERTPLPVPVGLQGFEVK
jgi:photosystem II stability/assembly factor-like uncharacterized protein